MQTIRFKYLKEISRTELDLQLYGDLTPNPEAAELLQDDRQVERVDEQSWSGEADALPIAELREIVDAIEDTQATHVEIFYHEDHHGYYFCPVRIEVLDGQEERRLQLRDIELRKQQMAVRLKQLKEEEAAAKRILADLEKRKSALNE
jgi:uncharacterized protein YlaN (UPF0358 family)